ncbi:MAG: glycosyltransferase family 4 protein [Candidatus Levyibacteriota bacterium]|nr:MAG: glycosyltransferase family 4 protein [Candidatus Levybacteria bacterium]
MRNHVLIISIGFLPNIGGLETHLKDLIDELTKKDWIVTVLTYQPLNTPELGKWIEKRKNLIVFRLPIVRGVFYKLYKKPFLEFLFLEPLLFLVTPLVLLTYSSINVVNAQGLIAGFSASFWTKIFRKRYVVSAQSIYHFPKKGFYRQICKWIFSSADKIIAISKQSKKDIETLGVSSQSVQIYTNWENSDLFKPIEKETAKKEVGFTNKFVVSFFGRLIEEKGVKVIIDAVKLSDRRITFVIYGEGPLVDYVKKAVQEYPNVTYMGTISPNLLPTHYSAADIILMPTLNEEGFGRVAAGALFCGTPVIASNRGALPTIVNDSVGKIIEPTPQEITKVVNFYFHNRHVLKKSAQNARKYALSKFSKKNVEAIISSYI